MTVNGAFVMGHPIAHSRSPMLHTYWLKRLGIEGSYERLDIPPEQLGAFFAGFREAGWIGGNVTVPHKLAVIPYLDAIDDDAKAMGAVNTIWWNDGALTGGNTDSLGFMGNIDELVPGWDRTAKRAVILGAGGATRAAAYGLMKRGLDVAICNRTISKAEALAEQFGKGVSAHGLDAVGGLLAGADLLVNTTSLGMIGQPPLEIDLTGLQARTVVYDVIYAPLDTDLLKQAKAKGCRTVDGLGMLLHQGVEGFRRWFKQTPEITGELRALLIDDIRAKTPGA
ncbi:shikimate dehydrogenase [Breoghania sp. L-A4]|uniref:shikimate dehydrogenase n=1 Tax=Breoghania sp. L-A4 TaxID=2304600 RepID=UPI000E3604CD|nr:shikimate dehydrogenase [Breoghania sp. L-A4]AXS41557.1 shikimate dehydrogenase [Breoghania sp. L-A4]